MERKRGLAALAAVLAVAVAAVLIARPGGVVSPSASPSTSSTSPAPPVSPAIVSLSPSASAEAAATPTSDLSAVSLLDIRADTVLRLIHVSGYVRHAGFDRERPEVLVGTTTAGAPDAGALYRFDLRGRQIDRAELPARGVAGDLARCNEIRSVYETGPGGPPPIVEVDGKRFDNVNCGAISPDGRRMTYWLWAGGASPGGLRRPIDQWVIDLATGERRALKGDLVHCGGCDSVPGPKWSPSGRYVYFSDLVAGGGRFFLADVRSGEVRALSDHVPRESFDVPVWSPVDDILIRSSGGRILLERVAEPRVSVLGEWPARFDRTGAYLYSPAWPRADGASPRTRVFEVATGALVAELPGAPETRTYLGIGGPPLEAWAVVGTPGGPIAALQGAPGCAGTTIHAAKQTCVPGASAPEIAPDGSMVALVRATGEVVTTQDCRSCFVGEIVLIDTASGREIATSSRSIRLPVESEVRRAIQHTWNEQSTHLLVSPRR